MFLKNIDAILFGTWLFCDLFMSIAPYYYKCSSGLMFFAPKSDTKL